MLVSSFDISCWTRSSTSYRSTYTKYWLELTNLATTDIVFEFAAHVTRYASRPYGQPTDPHVQLAELKNVVGGALAGDYWTWYAGGWSLEGNHPVLRLAVPVAANTSQPVRLSAFTSNLIPTVYGYVELTVPPIRSATAPFAWVPQSNGPVPVLLYPSTDESATQNGSEISSARQPLPLANGQAYNEITPETNPRVRRIPFRDLLIRNPAFVASPAALTDEEHARSLVEQLDSLEEHDRAALNELLRSMQSPYRIEEA